VTSAVRPATENRSGKENKTFLRSFWRRNVHRRDGFVDRPIEGGPRRRELAANGDPAGRGV
jgi:hypothetical protein